MCRPMPPEQQMGVAMKPAGEPVASVPIPGARAWYGPPLRVGAGRASTGAGSGECAGAGGGELNTNGLANGTGDSAWNTPSWTTSVSETGTTVTRKVGPE